MSINSPQLQDFFLYMLKVIPLLYSPLEIGSYMAFSISSQNFGSESKWAELLNIWMNILNIVLTINWQFEKRIWKFCLERQRPSFWWSGSHVSQIWCLIGNNWIKSAVFFHKQIIKEVTITRKMTYILVPPLDPHI